MNNTTNLQALSTSNAASLIRHIRAVRKGAYNTRSFAAILTAGARGAVTTRGEVYARELQRPCTARL